MTAWVVTEPTAWRNMSWQKQKEIRTWLRMNGIRPADVPSDSTVSLIESSPGVWQIKHERFRRTADGKIVLDPKKLDEAYVDEFAVPLEIDPPMDWLTPA